MSRVVSRLEIQEFRGIRKLTKPLELARFNVLVGRNNTGKTAILEALYIFSKPFPSVRDLLFNTSRVEFLAELHGGVESLVYGYAGEARLRFHVYDKTVNVVVFSRKTVNVTMDDASLLSYDDYVNFVKATLGVDLENQELAFYIPNSTRVLNELRTRLVESTVWSIIVKRGLHRKVIKELIVPVVYDRFTEVIIERGELKVRKEVDDEVGPLYIDVRDLGEGVKRVLLAALAIEYVQPRIVLWDDIEVAAHPGLIRAVLKWLSSREWQVLITTHSIDVLNELLQVRPKECQVIVLVKTSNDEVNYRVLTLDELEELMDRGIDVRKIVDELEL